jgi:hypothetical protein
MTVWEVVLVVIGALLLLALLGSVSASRRNRAGAQRFTESLTAADRQLAVAHAADRGWERATLEAAARAGFGEHRPGVEVERLELLRVLDEPGTDQDLAVFRVVAAGGGGASHVTLGRRDGEWYAAAVEDER